MNTVFEKLPDTARIWVYQANREMEKGEVAKIESMMAAFLDQWAAHGADLKSASKIYYNQFLVIALDESFNQASGCSIDSSVHFINGIEKELGINFFDRSKIAFLIDDKVTLKEMASLKQTVEKGQVNKNTLTFNNLVSNKLEFENHWITTTKDTWMKRYF